jgi:hypothetical protein
MSGRMLSALKVKEKWLRVMKGRRLVIQGRSQFCQKVAEVRKFPPGSKTPKGHTPVKVGDRIFLLGSGKVWASARLQRVSVYNNAEDFAEDSLSHLIVEPLLKGEEVAGFKSRLANGIPLYAWFLSEFRWFPADSRPTSGEIHAGVRVPDFKGQRYGHIWSSSQLPQALEEETGAVELSR